MTIKGLQAELAILKSSINSDTPTSVNHTGTSSSQSEQQVTLDMVDRKSNLVVFGMKECESGVNRGVHIITDTENVVQVFNEVNPKIHSSDIKDCFRLGKYKPDKVRPLLIKFHQKWKPDYILSRRSSLSSKVYIQPDLPAAVHKIKSILYKERRSLIPPKVLIVERFVFERTFYM